MVESHHEQKQYSHWCFGKTLLAWLTPSASPVASSSCGWGSQTPVIQAEHEYGEQGHETKNKKTRGNTNRTPAQEILKMLFFSPSNFLTSFENIRRPRGLAKWMKVTALRTILNKAGGCRFQIKIPYMIRNRWHSKERLYKWQIQVTCNQIRCKHIKFIKETRFVFLWSINNHTNKWTGGGAPVRSPTSTIKSRHKEWKKNRLVQSQKRKKKSQPASVSQWKTICLILFWGMYSSPTSFSKDEASQVLIGNNMALHHRLVP